MLVQVALCRGALAERGRHKNSRKWSLSRAAKPPIPGVLESSLGACGMLGQVSDISLWLENLLQVQGGQTKHTLLGAVVTMLIIRRPRHTVHQHMHGVRLRRLNSTVIIHPPIGRRRHRGGARRRSRVDGSHESHGGARASPACRAGLAPPGRCCKEAWASPAQAG